MPSRCSTAGRSSSTSDSTPTIDRTRPPIALTRSRACCSSAGLPMPASPRTISAPLASGRPSISALRSADSASRPIRSGSASIRAEELTDLSIGGQRQPHSEDAVDEEPQHEGLPDGPQQFACSSVKQQAQAATGTGELTAVATAARSSTGSRSPPGARAKDDETPASALQRDCLPSDEHVLHTSVSGRASSTLRAAFQSPAIAAMTEVKIGSKPGPGVRKVPEDLNLWVAGHRFWDQMAFACSQVVACFPAELVSEQCAESDETGKPLHDWARTAQAQHPALRSLHGGRAARRSMADSRTRRQHVLRHTASQHLIPRHLSRVALQYGQRS
jgi:hypothetical protein